MNAWVKLPGSERTTIGSFECDIWPTGDGARYSVMHKGSGRYLAGGKCASLEWAREVSSNFAQSLTDIARSKP